MTSGKPAATARLRRVFGAAPVSASQVRDAADWRARVKPGSLPCATACIQA